MSIVAYMLHCMHQCLSLVIALFLHQNFNVLNKVRIFVCSQESGDENSTHFDDGEVDSNQSYDQQWSDADESNGQPSGSNEETFEGLTDDTDDGACTMVRN